jgi:MraZ protein
LLKGTKTAIEWLSQQIGYFIRKEREIMFLGEYRLNVDEAGRLALPLSIRNVFHEFYAPEDTMLIVSSFFDNCLVLYPQDQWRKMPERLRREGACETLIREFQANKAVCLLDKEGRVYIPQAFRQHATIERDALLVGMVCSLELWSPHRWEGYEAANRG